MRFINKVALACYALMLAGVVGYVYGRFMGGGYEIALAGGVAFVSGLGLGTLLGAAIYASTYRQLISDVAYFIGMLLWVGTLFVPGLGALVMLAWNKNNENVPD